MLRRPDVIDLFSVGAFFFSIRTGCLDGLDGSDGLNGLDGLYGFDRFGWIGLIELNGLIGLIDNHFNLIFFRFSAPNLKNCATA